MPRSRRPMYARGFERLDVQTMLNRFPALILLALLSGAATLRAQAPATPPAPPAPQSGPAVELSAPVPAAPEPAPPAPAAAAPAAPASAPPAPAAAVPAAPKSAPQTGKGEAQPPATATPSAASSWFRRHRHRGLQPWVAAANPLAVDAGIEI